MAELSSRPPGVSMDASAVAQIELDLLLEAIFRRHGHDFRSYARASVERRVAAFVASKGYARISDLTADVLHDEARFAELTQTLSITVTEMFRDPYVFAALREAVFPVLRSWPRCRVWHAGCATGEEVYSLAILLHEAGLYDRSTIYATDFNDAALGVARRGIYDAGRMRDYAQSYREAGGAKTLGDYYLANYGSVAMSGALKQNLTFASHNLALDGVFGEMHLIVCRNVLIYFDRELQDRVFSLFADSLVRGGYLCLGSKEDLQFSSAASRFELVDREARIYRRVADR